MYANKGPQTRIGKAEKLLEKEIWAANCIRTAMGPKQIEQSCEEPLAAGFPELFNSRNRLWDWTL